MKKIFAILVAAMLVMSLSVSVFAAEATVTGTWTCSFTDNDYDSGVTDNTITGWAGTTVHAWGNEYPELVSLIETVAPISSVSHVEVTVKASNTDNCWSTNPKMEVDLNERGGEHLADAVAFDGDTATFGFDVPDGTTALVLVPYAFSAEAGDITFEISIVVTGDFEASAAPTADPEPVADPEPTDTTPEPATTPEPTTTTTTPEAPKTGLALAVVPAIVAMAAAVVSKKR